MTHKLVYKIKIFFRKLKMRIRKEQYAKTQDPKSFETGGLGNWDQTLVGNVLDREKKQKDRSRQSI
ncbi:MAG: hypothetical protein ACTSRE_01575 [Promethearchaeota archaeon]